MTLPKPLAEPQLLRLQQLLDEPALAEAMRLDEAQGYLCAALSGPQPMAEELWLNEVLGRSDSDSEGVVSEAADLFLLLAAGLEAVLASGEPPVLLLYPGTEDDSATDYAAWCEGYLAGVDAAADDWFDFLGAADDKYYSDEIAYLDGQLFPLFLLTGDAEAAATEAGEDWPSGEELEQLQAECAQKLPQAVSDIYRFWLAQRSVKTIRRDTPKVGRNDPCPCGSGKKFKKCCGS